MEKISIRYLGTTESGIITQNCFNDFFLSYPCSSSTSCSPYEITLQPGIYHVECRGGSGYDSEGISSLGGITSGSLSLSHEQTFFV